MTQEDYNRALKAKLLVQKERIAQLEVALKRQKDQSKIAWYKEQITLLAAQLHGKNEQITALTKQLDESQASLAAAWTEISWLRDRVRRLLGEPVIRQLDMARLEKRQGATKSPALE